MVVYNMVEVVDKNQTRTVDDILLEMMDSWWDLEDIVSITPIIRVPKMLPIGTKVRIAEEFDEYHSRGELKVTWIYIWNYTLKWDWVTMIAPLWAVIPVYVD